MFFGVTIKYDKLLESGLSKTINEQYVVDAMSFAEAEARIVEEMEPYFSGDFSVQKVNKIHIIDVVENDGGCMSPKWYMVKIAFVTIDEKTGNEKVSLNRSLVQADNLQDAIELFNKHMSIGVGMQDYYHHSVTETKYLDYFKAPNN